MRLATLLALALGCSSSSPSTDAGQGSSRPDLCVCPDVPPVEDVVAVAVDAPEAAVDAAVGVDAVDAVAVADDVPDASLPADVVAEDRPTDAVVVVDAVDVVQLVDAGPTDAGPETHDLDAVRGATEVRVLYRSTCAEQDGGPCGFAPVEMVRSGSCTRTGARLNFTLDTGYQITGLFPDYRSTTGATIAIVGGVANQGRDFVIEAGAQAGARQSFRVSFSALARSNAAGVTGVPGRTLSPERGDVWLLGCEVR